VLLMLGAPVHWGAKSMSLIVGVALGAAALIALLDGDDALGIFAANGLTKLVWGIAAAVLLILALLPRVGGKKKADDANRERARSSQRVSRPVERERRFERDASPAGDSSRSRGRGGSFVAPASGANPGEPRDDTP
jgi:hypothetical protein